MAAQGIDSSDIPMEVLESILEKFILPQPTLVEILNACIQKQSDYAQILQGSEQEQHMGINPIELKKRIKRERNPLARIKLQQEYDKMMHGNGRHKKGKR